jgi:hypothetical protein
MGRGLINPSLYPLLILKIENSIYGGSSCQWTLFDEAVLLPPTFDRFASVLLKPFLKPYLTKLSHFL